SEHDVDRSDQRDQVADEMALRQPWKGLEVDERRRPDVHAVRAVRAVRNAVEPELVLRRLDRRVGLLGGWLDHPRDLASDLAGLEPLDALPDDPHALAHLLDADDVAVVSVAVHARRDREV